VLVDTLVVVGPLDEVVADLLDGIGKDVVVVTEGKERDVLLLGTLQNCCASNSAAVSSAGHPLETQSTIFLVKRSLGYQRERHVCNRFHNPNDPRT
jgi:hypothetical protein